MGLTGSSVRKYIESNAFQPPEPGYTRTHPNLYMIDSVGHSQIATMHYKVNNGEKIIIYSHGNATDIGYMDTFLSNLAKTIRINLISYDYEGYGLSRGVASEAGAIRSINIVYNHLISIGYLPNEIILYGVSIGTGPTVELASKLSQYGEKLGGVLLQTPYTSVAGVVSQIAEHTFYASSYVVENSNIFRSSETISLITVPVTLIHGDRDEIIDHSHSVTLYKILKKTNRYAKFITIPYARHNNIESDHLNILIRCLVEFLAV
jgi:fermentation-respiration switch protein FrsA (DUF1100 family)